MNEEPTSKKEDDKGGIKKMNENKRDYIPFWVYIIESPSPEDLYYNINEGEILLKTLPLLGIKTIRNITASSNLFKKALTEDIYTISENFKKVPVLHISTHGNKRGLKLTDESIVSWDKLKEYLGPINQEYKDILIICLSACESWTGCEMAMCSGTRPYFYLIGCIGSPSWRETVVGFTAFYNLLTKRQNFNEIINAMNSASGGTYFTGATAKDVQASYFNVLATQLKIAERKNFS